MKQHFAAAHRLQLGEGFVVRAGFADLQAVVGGDLIRADHERMLAGGQFGCDRPRFGLGEPQRGRFGRFARLGRLVDRRHDDVERHAQAFEQLAAIARTRRQNQAWRAGKGIRHGEPTAREGRPHGPLARAGLSV